MKWTNQLGKWLGLATLVAGTGAVSAGCLSRPVGTQPPTTKVNFTATVSQQQVDKVDLLFMIDNSESMGDKQAILADAVPMLLGSLLRPKCVDPASGLPPEGSTAVADPNGNKGNRYGCPDGLEPEFAPVTDMHIGIISSSLGNFGGDVCDTSAPRNNDRARLLNLVAGGTLPEAGDSKFLSWYPDNDDNQNKDRHPEPPTPAVRTLNELQDHFQKLVVGVGQNGCGLEAQLESVYRFLIQPDPWVEVTRDDKFQADLGGPNDVDAELLRQRADFLRPDSLVAIILLTDEDDSSVDPLSVGGQGWAFMARQFPSSRGARPDGSTTAPRATSACRTDPGSEDCTSCGFAAGCDASSPACQKIKNDPECQKTEGYYAGDEEQLNVRFHRMKERFGIDPQYPISRYVDGLTKRLVPDRTTEHTIRPRGDGGRDITAYLGTPKCTNPLFAAKLPRTGDDICNLPAGRRGPELIFFAVVGGVPNDLLHFDPTDAAASELDESDWVKILGRTPEAYNYDGIDPHMVQSVAPRPGVPGPSDTRGDNGDPSDPVGRDWRTGNNDLQYACTFPLPTPRTCTSGEAGCDCADPSINPPLCGSAVGSQIRAKAYPTIREFMVVRKLGAQGIAASLCPITLSGDPSAATYGYNPAVKSIVDRLKNALTAQCLPQKLTRDASGEVPCLVLAQLGDNETCSQFGLQPPAQEILDKFREQQRAKSGDVSQGGVDLSRLPVCVVPQYPIQGGDSCKGSADANWCYVEASTGQCAQQILFSTGSGVLANAQFSLQCINQFEAGEAASN